MDETQRRLAEELLFAKPKKASFGKSLYFGHFDSTQIFPYPFPKPKEKQKTDEFVAQVRQFIEKELDPDAIDRKQAIPDHVIRGLGKLGVLSMTVSKEYGGLGMSQYAYCRAVEAIAYRCSSTALFVNAHQSVGLKALLLFGTEEQRKKWLVSLSKGESLAAFALTEPNAGIRCGRD